MLVSNKLVRNEQRKLTATYMNGLSMAVMGVGCFTPIVAMTLTVGPLPPVAFAMGLRCMTVSFGLHFFAKFALQELEE